MFVGGFPEGEKILVLAPHPDDEALGCGGTVSALNQSGKSSSLVFITNGELLHGSPSDDIARERMAEGRRSAALMGCSDARFLGFPDGGVAGRRDEVANALSSVVHELKPEIVLCPSLVDYHPDHIATAEAALTAASLTRSFALVFYEVYTTLRFNYLFDITAFSNAKERVIMNYVTSLSSMPDLYSRAVLGLNAHRAIFVQKQGYFEAFYRVPEGAGAEDIATHMGYGDIRRPH